jgi:hypothetical protein
MIMDETFMLFLQQVKGKWVGSSFLKYHHEIEIPGSSFHHDVIVPDEILNTTCLWDYCEYTEEFDDYSDSIIYYGIFEKKCGNPYVVKIIPESAMFNIPINVCQGFMDEEGTIHGPTPTSEACVLPKQLSSKLLKYTTWLYPLKKHIDKYSSFKFTNLESCVICSELLSGRCSQLDCGHLYHHDCILKWGAFGPGDFIDKSKSQCPICRKVTVKVKFPQIKDENPESVYRICKNCKTPFEAGPKSCLLDREQFPKKCEKCNIFKLIECPNCNQGLEHSGACLQFTCCLFGTEKCKGEACSHGNTDNIKFCGYKWMISLQHTNYLDE